MDVLCEYTAAQEFMSGVEHLNGLLHYALTHPPPNLTVVLPKGFDCVEELDVSICPIPVRQYRKAAANPEKEYIYDIGRRLSFLGGRAGSLPASRRREASWSWGSPSHGITVGADAFDEQVHPGTAAPPPREGGAKGLAQRGKHLISSLFSVRGAGSVAEAPTMSVAGPSRPLTPRRLDSGAGNSLLDEGRSLLSLFGAETFSMADHWANTLGGRSTVMDEAPTRFAPTPPAYAADLCSVFQPQLCQTFGGSFFLFVYEHLLLSAAWSNPADMTVALGIIKSIYRPLFGVEDQQHNRSLQCLAPLLTEVHVSCEAALDVREVAGTVLDSQPHAAPPCVAFRARMEALVAASTSVHHDDGQPDGEAAGRYPLAIRAALLAGALVPVHRADLRENLAAMEGVRRCVNAMQRLLDVPAEVADYCHVHAQLLALDDSGVDMSAQCANLAHLTELVHGLGGHQDEENLPLTPERKYRYFVLQEVLSIAITPIPWVHTYNSTMVPRCVLALAIETCLSLQPSFLSLNILVNGRPLMSVRHSSGVFVLLLLSVLFTSSFLQECPTICPEVGDGCDGTCAKRRTTKSETVPSFEASLDGLAERIISSNQMAICRVLSGTIPVAQALLLPVFLQMGVFMLGKHWARSLTNMDLQHATQDEERGGSGARASAEMQIPIQLPEDFEASLNTLATYLGATLPPSSRGPASSESPPPNEEVLTALAMHASRSLAPLHHYVSRYDRQRRWELEAAVEELERQHHAVGWAADGALHQDVRIPRKDLSEAAMRCFGRPFAPALVSDPRGVHQARLAFYGVVMRRFIALVEVPQEVMQSARASATKAGNTILSSSPPPSSPTRPTLALQLRALVGLAATIHSSSTKGKGLTCQALLHRCNTLLELRQIHDNFMRAVAEQHSLVGAITGRPDDGSAAEQLRTTIAMADSAAVEEQLCQLLAIATLLESKVFALVAPHVGFRGSASERRQLRQLVGTCTTSAGHHQTLSDTSFSVSRTLAQLYRLLNCQVMPLLHDAKMVQQVREWAGMYFVELLYGVLVEGDGKWPNAASSITGADFDLITNFFTSQAATTFATPSLDDAVDDLAVFGDRIVLEEGLNEHISPGEAMARRLAELRWIHGQVGRLSAAQLKEALAGSSTMRPCWRFIIEAVLEHHPK